MAVSELTFSHSDLDDHIDDIGLENIEAILMNSDNLNAINKLDGDFMRWRMHTMLKPITDEDFQMLKEEYKASVNNIGGVQIIVDEGVDTFKLERK